MTTLHSRAFIDGMELKGVYLDKSNKLNMGFTFENQTFKQKSAFKVLENKQIFFEHEGVMHLNESKTSKICSFCNKFPSHLSTCTSLSESELQNIVIENALQKIEQHA